MEVMVAMSIFIIVALASLTIYAAILRASQRTTAYTRIQQEAQLIMEVLAKKIRTSRLNYEYYATKNGIPFKTGETYNEVVLANESELALTDLAGVDYLFSLADQALTIKQGTGEPVQILSSLVSIDSLAFFIEPKRFPFDINLPPETQPRVTLVVTFSSTKGTQTASFTVQQTVPQRSGGIVD